MTATAPPSPGFSPAALLGPAFLGNPYALYAQLRRSSPVFRLPLSPEMGAGAVVLTRWSDVRAVLRDPVFSVDRRRAHVVQRNRDRLPPDFVGFSDDFRSMLTMDAPDHDRVRGIVSRAFTPRRVAALRPFIETLTQELLAPARDESTFDLMETLAAPLPAMVIAELLGIPRADWSRFKEWATDLVSVGPAALSGDGQERFRRGFQSLSAYLSDVIAERRRRPGEDLVSALVMAQVERDALDDGELLANSVVLLIAGHETTTNLIGNGALALLQHPGELARLRADRALLKSAIEEMLRFDSPVQATVRVPVRDTEIAGVPIAEGTLVVCGIGAANRDPEVFPEPDCFDVGRSECPHLSFGFGAHFCLGAPLARLEGEVAFSALLDTFPKLALAGATPAWRPHPILRGLLSLPLRAEGRGLERDTPRGS